MTDFEELDKKLRQILSNAQVRVEPDFERSPEKPAHGSQPWASPWPDYAKPLSGFDTFDKGIRAATQSLSQFTCDMGCQSNLASESTECLQPQCLSFQEDHTTALSDDVNGSDVGETTVDGGEHPRNIIPDDPAAMLNTQQVLLLNTIMGRMETLLQ